MEIYTMTGETGIVRGIQGASSAPSARRRGFSALGSVKPATVAVPRAEWTPGIVDHNWTGVSVPGGRCRPPA